MIIVYLRNVGDDEDPCWVVCAKGDSGALAFTRPESQSPVEMFKCNCPHEVRAGCSEPKCPHYVPERKAS